MLLVEITLQLRKQKAEFLKIEDSTENSNDEKNHNFLLDTSAMRKMQITYINMYSTCLACTEPYM